MNAKIQKISNEILKIKEKISEFQAKVKDLEKQKTELENADIINAVRGSDITLADLAAMLKSTKTGSATSGQVGPESATLKNEENKEDIEQ